MLKQIRILPITILALVLVFGLKLGSFWTDTREAFLSLEVANVEAKEEPAKEEEAKAEEAPAQTEEKPEAEATSEATTESTTSNVDVSNLSSSEIEVLQRLVERRDQLQKREEELDLRENLLKATEQRIDGKITKLKDIEKTIQDLLRQYDDQELKKLKSLVAIYEKMKPKDAARIFNTLDMDVLLDVTSMMKESKLATILGSMSGARAKELTVELATRKQLPDMTEKGS